MKVLVLGHNGMLGHMLVKYLTTKGHIIETTDERFPSDDFKKKVLEFDGEYIINAIGAIPQKVKQFDVNFELPIWLSENVKVRIIHPGTDCEIDEDEYGTSKRDARNYIVTNSSNTKIIKASILGPEIKDKKSLLEWFLNTKDEVIKGWSLAMWSGITTLEWSKHCETLMNNWNNLPTENIVESTCLSKYDLLVTMGEVFEVRKQFIKNDTVKINKCLMGNLHSKNIKEQLKELKTFYYEKNFVNY
jgi:dTDP-4-dehydrorhamnose reductase